MSKVELTLAILKPHVVKATSVIKVRCVSVWFL